MGTGGYPYLRSSGTIPSLRSTPRSSSRAGRAASAHRACWRHRRVLLLDLPDGDCGRTESTSSRGGVRMSAPTGDLYLAPTIAGSRRLPAAARARLVHLRGADGPASPLRTWPPRTTTRSSGFCTSAGTADCDTVGSDEAAPPDFCVDAKARRADAAVIERARLFVGSDSGSRTWRGRWAPRRWRSTRVSAGDLRGSAIAWCRPAAAPFDDQATSRRSARVRGARARGWYCAACGGPGRRWLRRLVRPEVQPIQPPWIYELIRDRDQVDVIVCRNAALLDEVLSRWHGGRLGP